MYFGHLNINSLLSKIEELRTLAFNTNISVLGITKTKLNNTVSNEELKIDDYNLLRSDRNKNDGRVACYIKNNIAHNRQWSISENIENIVLDILLPKSKPIILGIIYRLPDQVDFIDHFNNALDKLPLKSNEIYLLGEFNIKVNKSVYIAKSRQRYYKTLHNILLHVPNHALKYVYMLNYGTTRSTNSSYYTSFFILIFFIIQLIKTYSLSFLHVF